jgi:hypothetical protein
MGRRMSIMFAMQGDGWRAETGTWCDGCGGGGSIRACVARGGSAVYTASPACILSPMQTVLMPCVVPWVRRPARAVRGSLTRCGAVCAARNVQVRRSRPRRCWEEAWLAALRAGMQCNLLPPPVQRVLLICVRDLRGRYRRGSVESACPRPDRAVDRVSTAPRCAGW